jgi:pyruvate dehydrogenase E1 component alpha subunit
MPKKQDKQLITKELYKENLRLMLLVRRFEERAGQAYGMGLIAGFCHLYIGQEAVIAGSKAALDKDDSIITSYRDHGHILACGVSSKEVMAELYGKETGVSRGKGGSMHLFSIKDKFYGGHGIVAAQVPIGTGIAFADKYRDKKNVTLVFLGDGAANQGQVYESFNMASLWNLPVIYIIENNKYGMGTSVERSSATGEFYKRGEAFGIEGRKVDGMRFATVYEEVKKAREVVLKENRPFLLEIETYRYRGHSMSDPGNYRTKEELNDYKENHDPINSFRKYGVEEKLISDAEYKDLDSEIKKEVKEAMDFAEESSEPLADELYTDVYSEE